MYEYQNTHMHTHDATSKRKEHWTKMYDFSFLAYSKSISTTESWFLLTHLAMCLKMEGTPSPTCISMLACTHCISMLPALNRMSWTRVHVHHTRTHTHTLFPDRVWWSSKFIHNCLLVVQLVCYLFPSNVLHIIWSEEHHWVKYCHTHIYTQSILASSNSLQKDITILATETNSTYNYYMPFQVNRQFSPPGVQLVGHPQLFTRRSPSLWISLTCANLPLCSSHLK